MRPFCHAGYVPQPAGGPPSHGWARRWSTGAALAAAFVLARAVPAAAEDASSRADATPADATPADATPTHTQCQVTDPRLPELSGLAVVDDRMVVMNDGGEELAVYVLDAACQAVDVRTAPIDPYAPEDLAVGADNTVWLADVGDTRVNRPTVALLALRPDGSTGVFRMTYPDGPHDAESLLLAPDGTPYLVTKDILGASGVYRPTSALVDGGTV